MDYRTLGRTGLRVSALALGTVELGMEYGIRAPGQSGRPSDDAAVDLVHAALDAGINFIDTARAYGESERVLGRALAGRRDQVVLATKVEPRPPAGVTWTDAELRQAMVESLETSLRLLRTDYVDLWMIHSIDEPLLARHAVLTDVFDAARRRGLIGWSGASFYGVDLPRRALALDLFDVMQVSYSVLDQRLAADVLPLARAAGVGVVARSVLLKGALTERGDHLPARLRPLIEHSRRFRTLLQATNPQAEPAQGAIAFALAQPLIDSVLVGVNSWDELQDDLGALELSLSPDCMADLEALALNDPRLLDPGTWSLP